MACDPSRRRCHPRNDAGYAVAWCRSGNERGLPLERLGRIGNDLQGRHRHLLHRDRDDLGRIGRSCHRSPSSQVQRHSRQRNLLSRHDTRICRMGGGTNRRRGVSRLGRQRDRRHCSSNRRLGRHGTRQRTRSRICRSAAKERGSVAGGGKCGRKRSPSRVDAPSCANLRDRQDLAPNDRSYVAQLVARRTGLSQADAEKRVSDVTAQIKSDLDAARKATLQLALWLTASLFMGAFAASIAAAEAGAFRDRNWGVRTTA